MYIEDRSQWSSAPTWAPAIAVRPEAWDGLVGLWGMLEGGGGTAYDLSGQGNTRTLSGPDWVPEGLEFNGTGDEIDLGTANILEEFTICARVKIPSDETYSVLLGWHPSGSQPAIYLDYGGLPVIYFGANNYRKFVAAAWTTLVDGNWHDVAFTLTGNAQADINNSAMYLDGQSVAIDSTDATGALIGKFDHMLGSVRSARYFKGTMSMAAYYNRALTPNQISQWHALGLAYWLERRMAASYKYLAPSGGTILPHMMQLCA